LPPFGEPVCPAAFLDVSQERVFVLDGCHDAGVALDACNQSRCPCLWQVCSWYEVFEPVLVPVDLEGGRARTAE
jgi:hypothetical protein